MTDRRDDQAESQRESCRINFEIPGDFMAEMQKMMAGRRDFAAKETSCCGPMPDPCCTPSVEKDSVTFVIEIKRKES